MRRGGVLPGIHSIEDQCIVWAPSCLGGVQFGVGVLVSSVLFGLLHALNSVDYFESRSRLLGVWPAPSALDCCMDSYERAPAACWQVLYARVLDVLVIVRA